MVQSVDEGNTVLVKSTGFVDSLNAAFYSEYQYPWAPMSLDRFLDPQFEIAMVNQSIGDWDCRTIPVRPAVWVAGCGTNQAAMTALRFPAARVLGSDLSPKSLQTCASTASQVGATNLELKRESITDATYDARFDYIRCTGVIHHTADPEAALSCLAKALKPSGVMELMVYNRYHRAIVSAVQRAVRILEDARDGPDFRVEIEIARGLVESGDVRIGQTVDQNESALADALIQPVEYGYTVESLEAMAERCGLELLTPCIDPSDMARDRYEWNIRFKNPALRDRYEALPDSRRWQVTNLLRREASPMLWFYLQRKDSGRCRPSELEICEAFLDHAFRLARTEREIYVRRGDRYERSSARRPHPGVHPDSLCREVIDCVAHGPERAMREVLAEIGADTSFYAVSRLRLGLTTVAAPYLRAAGVPASSPDPH